MFAYERGIASTSAITREEQKKLGQFMTPPGIARLMARQLSTSWDSQDGTVEVLDPAAGTGMLAAAAVETLLERTDVSAIRLTMVELDSRLRTDLQRLADRMRRATRRAGKEVSIRIICGDFLLSDLAWDAAQFDLVIANPPYFKIGKRDSRAIRHAYAVHGQPNIYALFMAACSRLLNPGGRWCFITPRSWTNGAYFSRTRRELLRTLHIDAIHLFGSRQDHFSEDEVLQEAMITWASANDPRRETVRVSCSRGLEDIDRAALTVLPASRVIGSDEQRVIRLPEAGAMQLREAGMLTLSASGYKVSTGPVVAFRSNDYLRTKAATNTVPLLWMQHIGRMRINWPINKKAEHIVAAGGSSWMLLPNDNMVVLRRFSPKEDLRRVTAAPLFRGSTPGRVVGLENHTNYICRPGASMSEEEVVGLAAFLNSGAVDAYLRSVSGSTQVNATDLRQLPIPTLEDIQELGRAVCPGMSLAEIDALIAGQLGHLIHTHVA